MKDLKQGKIISIHTSKPEDRTVIVPQEKQKVEQMYSELQEISQKIDQHLNKSTEVLPPDKQEIKTPQKLWQMPLFYLKKNFLKAQSFSRYSGKFKNFRKFMPPFKRKD